MKGKIRIILDELRDIERTEGLGAITEGKINEICKAQGVSFDEFKSSVLKILAEEAGISLDELNSFLLEEIGELEKISELDLDKISGGASVSDAVKRGAASLMAILNLSGMSNSYADSSDKVVTDHRATINDEIDDEDYEYDEDDEVPYEKVALNKKEMLKKWAKRLGIPVTVLLVAVIGLNKLKNDVTADQILDAYYQKLGSHACMEGHSPGEIPLGGGGIERVLMIGYDETKDKEVIKEARDQGLRVNCITEVPQTRAEFIAAFEGCT